MDSSLCVHTLLDSGLNRFLGLRGQDELLLPLAVAVPAAQLVSRTAPRVLTS